VGPLLPYAAGKAQVSHPLGIYVMGTHLGDTILLTILFFCVCVCVCVFLFCRCGFFTLEKWFFFLFCWRLVPCLVCVKSCLV